MLLKNNINEKAVSKQLGHATEIITVDVYADNEEIIADCLDELEPFIEGVKPQKKELTDNDFSDDNELLEQQESLIIDLLPIS